MTATDSALRTALEHHQAGRLDAAEAIYRQVLAQLPNHAGALHLSGVIALQRGRPADAIGLIRRAIAANPREAVFYNNLGEAHRAVGEMAAAQSAYERAIALYPGFGEAHNNLGLVRQTAGDVPGAESAFRRALELRPDSVDAHYNLSRVRLLEGDFKEGWREYAWRRRLAGHPSQSMTAPAWDGSSLGDQRLFVYAEQGLGDTLQFIRYVPLLQDRANDVVVAVHAKLIPLLAASGFENLVSLDDPPPPHDLQCSLLDLPGLLGTTLKTIPAEVPYLRVDPSTCQRWRPRLTRLAGFKVGLVWQGNPSYYSDCFRSFPLAAFEPLAGVPGVQLVNLQEGEGAGQLDNPGLRFAVTRLDGWDAEHTFLDAAAAMLNLDLVVTSDTAAAHLAGGLGVPAWVALSLSPCWRWLLDRSDSPWYPTMRLFRQKKLGDWSDVFAEMAEALSHEREQHNE